MYKGVVRALSKENRGLVEGLLQASPSYESAYDQKDPFEPAKFMRPDSTGSEGTVVGNDSTTTMGD